MKTALILLNGDLRDPRAARAAARAADWLICADGGARHAAALGLTPDFVVGDMDSSPRRCAPAGVTFVIDGDQSRSDFDKALDLAKRLGAGKVFVAAARGGSLDHELVNIGVLEKSRGMGALVIDGGTARLLGPGRHRLPVKKGARFSLLAAPRARVTLTGARFGLKNEVLLRGSRGLGNRADGAVLLTVGQGKVWVIDAAPFRG